MRPSKTPWPATQGVMSVHLLHGFERAHWHNRPRSLHNTNLANIFLRHLLSLGWWSGV
jgi:hypothetical protein